MGKESTKPTHGKALICLCSSSKQPPLRNRCHRVAGDLLAPQVDTPLKEDVGPLLHTTGQLQHSPPTIYRTISIIPPKTKAARACCIACPTSSYQPLTNPLVPNLSMALHLEPEVEICGSENKIKHKQLVKLQTMKNTLMHNAHNFKVCALTT